MRLLLVFLIPLFVAIHVQAQSDLKRPVIYTNVYLGFMPDDDNHASFNLSVGYQVQDWLGLGLTYAGQTEIDGVSESFSALALQYRITPGKHLIASADIGFALNYNKPNDCTCVIEYVPGFYPYYKGNLAWRFNKAFSLGFGVFALPRAQMETTWYDFDDNGNQVWEAPNIHEYMMTAAQFTLGFQFN
jgi:long-subunit fatty acid transport protein